VTARGLLGTTHASQACSSDPTAREPRPRPRPRPRSPLPATARTLTPARAHPTSDCTRTARHNTRQPSMQLGPDGPRAPAPRPRPRSPLPASSPHTHPGQSARPRVTARGLLGTTHASQACSSDPTGREPRPPPRPRSPLPATARTLTPARAHPTSDCTRTARHNTRQQSMQLGPDGPRAPAAPPRPRSPLRGGSPIHSPLPISKRTCR